MIKKVVAIFFFNSNNNDPKVPENTAIANAAVTHAGTS